MADGALRGAVVALIKVPGPDNTGIVDADLAGDSGSEGLTVHVRGTWKCTG